MFWGDFLRTHLVTLSPTMQSMQSIKNQRVINTIKTIDRGCLLEWMSSQFNKTALPKKPHTLEGLELGSAAFGAAGMPLRLAVRV
jgi:hypothetical protein